MPVDLQWHSQWPVLVATYTGTLTPKAYAAMCDKRWAMLADEPDRVILLVNAQGLEGLRDVASFVRDDAILHDERVVCTLVVLPEDLYHRVTRTVKLVDQNGFPVQFFCSVEDALAAASQQIPR